MADIKLGDIPDYEIVPAGFYRCKINALKRTQDDLRTYFAGLSILEPEEYRGLSLTDRFVFGSDDDPNADDMMKTRRRPGVIRLRHLIDRSGAPVETIDDEDHFCADVKGVEVGCRVTLYKNKGIVNPDNKGKVANAVRDYFVLGSTDIEVDEDSIEKIFAQEV